jgi:NTP pyrophosphatase (non-canonical NTP hydrolase)
MPKEMHDRMHGVPVNEAAALNDLAAQAYEIARSRGWHDERDIEGVTRNASAGERVALIHEEATELLGYVRKGEPASFYIEVDGKPEGAGAELADIIIRCLDYAGAYGIPIGEIVVHKMAFNATRDIRHGGMAL